jgi:hypothetical protein
MTYQDPKLPDPGLGRNPPMYPKPDAGSWGTGTIVAIVVAGVLVAGGLFYTMSGSSKTATINPPPVTTGQGMPVSPSVAPRMTPAPAAPLNAAPSIDQNVPAEKIAPAIPSEPRTNN